MKPPSNQEKTILFYKKKNNDNTLQQEINKIIVLYCLPITICNLQNMSGTYWVSIRKCIYSLQL